MYDGLILIEVCDANEACTDLLTAMETIYPGVSVLETSCMSECDLCVTSSYVFFNGEICQAPDVPSLIEMLRDRIEELQQDYETDT